MRASTQVYLTTAAPCRLRRQAAQAFFFESRSSLGTASSLAARMKSFSVRPSRARVQSSTLSLFHPWPAHTPSWRYGEGRARKWLFCLSSVWAIQHKLRACLQLSDTDMQGLRLPASPIHGPARAAGRQSREAEFVCKALGCSARRPRMLCCNAWWALDGARTACKSDSGPQDPSGENQACCVRERPRTVRCKSGWCCSSSATSPKRSHSCRACPPPLRSSETACRKPSEASE